MREFMGESIGRGIGHGARVPHHADSSSGTVSLRADARENRDRILLAARQVFADQGPGAPLEEIARQAGVGIATLYRRFPDRQALVRGVALDIWRRVAQEAQWALAEEPDAFRALTRYMHCALDLRIGAVMPALAGQVPIDDEVRGARDRSAALVQQMIDQAQAEGTLRPDVAFGDIGLLVIRLSRPYHSPFPRDLDDRIAHRHLDLLIDGLRHVRDRPVATLSGPALTLEDLLTLPPAEPSADRPSDLPVAPKEAV
jgi:AcrR family transcriptional regulator